MNISGSEQRGLVHAMGRYHMPGEQLSDGRGSIRVVEGRTAMASDDLVPHGLRGGTFPLEVDGKQITVLVTYEAQRLSGSTIHHWRLIARAKYGRGEIDDGLVTVYEGDLLQMGTPI